jgi:streptomycin 3"-adenylyltransferase
MNDPTHEATASLDRESSAYADEMAGRLQTILGDNLVGVYLHGSLVLGDFSRERSDIDIMAVSDHALSPEQKRAVADQVSSASLPCPVGELEFHVVARDGLG